MAARESSHFYFQSISFIGVVLYIDGLDKK